LGKAATQQTNLAAHKTKPPPHRLALRASLQNDNEQKTTLAQDSSTAGTPISRNVLSYFLCPRATVRSCVHASQTVSLAARFRVEVTLLWKSWRM
jgi:hypothetical protein